MHSRVYSPWLDTDRDARLQARGIEILIATGIETDGYVLAAVLRGVDSGYLIVLVTDGHQIHALTIEEEIERWR
jgi:nicotinamidase-related amidase